MKRPNEPVKLTSDEVMALKSLFSDDHHIKARLVIINKICRFNNVDFFTEAEGGSDAISFMNGRRFVAMEMLRHLMSENTSEAKEATK